MEPLRGSHNLYEVEYHTPNFVFYNTIYPTGNSIGTAPRFEIFHFTGCDNPGGIPPILKIEII